MKASDLSIGQIVYIYCDPRYVNDPSQPPVWECSIESIEITTKLDEDGETSQVSLRLECGADNPRSSLDNVFFNREDAMAHAAQEIRKKRSFYISKAKQMSAVLGLIEEGDFLENWMK
jgi:hypothetical protein